MTAQSKDDEMHAYCNTCGNTDTIKSNVVSKTNYNEELAYTNPFQLKDMVDDVTYLRTIDYECPNEQCITHKGGERMAVMFRDKRDLSQHMVCSACHTLWRI